MRGVGCSDEEAATVAKHLVDANLSGHDSHGVLRVSDYVKWIQEGVHFPGRLPATISENDAVAVIDGNFAIGHVVGEHASRVGTTKAARIGVALVCVRNAGHLGRLGAWAEMAAFAGQASLHFANGPSGLTVAPFGGTDRRLATTPIAIGVPTDMEGPLVFDGSTSMTSVGKIQHARNARTKLPVGWIIDNRGQPSIDPEDFFQGGALLAMGMHKGFGLNALLDVLVGAVSGGGASSDAIGKPRNNMISIYICLAAIAQPEWALAEIRRFARFVTASPPADPNHPVRLPGESARAIRAKRSADGVPIDAGTWNVIVQTASKVGVSPTLINDIMA